jgi:D-alanine-D-alanine ligase
MRVLPLKPSAYFVYSLEIKRDWQNRVRYECPAQLPKVVFDAVCRDALAAYSVLGCRDLARIDFRLRKGQPYFLEANPLPDLNPISGDLIEMAKCGGWSYEQLIGSILHFALDRCFQT